MLVLNYLYMYNIISTAWTHVKVHQIYTQWTNYYNVIVTLKMQLNIDRTTDRTNKSEVFCVLVYADVIKN